MVKNKKAKTAHREKTLQTAEETTKLVMLDGPHRVDDMLSFKTKCGEWRQGWRYGTEDQIVCVECLGVVEDG